MIETIKFSEAIRSYFSSNDEKNKNIILIGLGTNDPKGIFGTTAGLSESFGTNRVIEPPTSEASTHRHLHRSGCKRFKASFIIRE